ncbi:probable protein phosphatase DDB_G0279461 [Chenopodium quinoa]|uniref:probable protein phosphatase DDB_G0279461 n=1 Tax=Chenopodium quinoa TaxID=63459 RepID=UPI000B78731A|nr:probable protein phosphatase DDB_G0279461 [Chenopodium quinoa]
MEEKRDQEEELKHVCKLCNKRYPSGKSLGGHMRSHVIANRNNNINNHNHKPISIPFTIPKKSANFDYVSDENDDDENGGKNSGYGLRENPKKSWRLVDSTLLNKHLHHQFQQPQEREREMERICRQCGKGFHSLKALCGHMSSHSEKDRNFKEDDEEEDEEEDDNSWSSHSKNHLISTMESDNSDNSNKLCNKRRTRSSLTRYSSLTPPPPPATDGCSGGGGSSSNHSEIDQHEQEEVAMCLMMLSRDSSGHKSCFNFTAESSDNNSVILEGGSSTNHVGILRIKDTSKMIKKVVVVAKEEEEEVEEEINVINNDNNNHHESMDNSDSGYFENGAKELESDDSVDGFVRNYGFKKPKVEFGSCFYDDDNNDDSGKRRRIRGGLVGDYSRFDHNPESDENSSKKMKIKKKKMLIKQDYYGCIKKGSKYECWVCNKTFKTHQALGGHIISHRKNGDNSFDASITRINDNNNFGKQNLVGVSSGKIMGTSATTSSKSKKVKGHKCPYCPRVFKSGQALGGHKRSHMMGAGRGVVKLEEKPRITRQVVVPPMPEPEHQQQQQPPLIDLNLPAPMEEEGNSQFVAW